MSTRSLTILCAILIAACTRDPLEEAAWQASRVGTAAGAGRRGRDTAGLEAGARITERFYYVAKYQASREQRAFAEATMRRVAPRLSARSGGSARQAARYLAVRTRSDSRAKTATSVVVWDTQSQEIVGNSVYDLNTAPPNGALLNFDTYSAEYVGSGG